jgi:hypothetical protein
MYPKLINRFKENLIILGIIALVLLFTVVNSNI